MEYFAAHRIWIWNHEEVLVRGRIGVDGADRHVVTVERLDGEMERTIWLGGLIILAPCCMPRLPEESFSGYMERNAEEGRFVVHEDNVLSLFAYHAYPFNVPEMEFLPSTRIVRL